MKGKSDSICEPKGNEVINSYLTTLKDTQSTDISKGYEHRKGVKIHVNLSIYYGRDKESELLCLRPSLEAAIT